MTQRSKILGQLFYNSRLACAIQVKPAQPFVNDSFPVRRIRSR